MIFLQITLIVLITFYFSTALNNTLTKSNQQNMDKAYTNSQETLKAEDETIGYRIKTRNDSTVTSNLKNNLSRLNAKSKHLLKRKDKTLIKLLRSHTEQHLETNSTPVIGYTERKHHNNGVKQSSYFNFRRRNIRKNTIRKQINPYNALYVPTENHTTCTFSFDTESLLKAKLKLTEMKGYFLFYVNITINGFKNPKNDDVIEKKIDMLTHWQYVRKEEKFMVQLPVDFDLLTYNMLVFDHEETTLYVSLVYDASNCSENEFLDQNENVRSLLWNELFDRNTSYYLCNRIFNKNIAGRLSLYFLTTIWVGYDLNCSAVSHDGGFSTVEINKDHLPLVAPIFCYILSLQFVWIFVLLDLNDDSEDCELNNTIKRKKSNDKTKRTVTQLKKNRLTLKLLKQKRLRLIELNRERLKHKQLSKKRLNLKQPTNNFFKKGQDVFEASKHIHKPRTYNTDTINSKSGVKGTKIRCRPYTKTDRPYGIKRFITKILYAPCCSKKAYVCCCCKCKLRSISPTARLLLLMYCFILFPFGLYRTVCRFSLNKMYNNYHTVVRTSEPLFSLIAKSSETWALVLDIIYAIICPFFYIFLGQKLYEQYLENDLRLCSLEKKEQQMLIISNKRIIDRFTFQYYRFCSIFQTDCCKDDGENGKCDCSSCLRNTGRSVLGFVFCLFQIIPFSCYKCNGKQNKNGSDDQTNCDRFIKFICFIMLYSFCLRPTISTFTFLFRSFTYYVFVALPIRVHILRYTMLIGTTVTYFVKYFHEFINMNSDILKYLFTCEEESLLVGYKNNSNTNKNTEVNSIREEMFDYVYEQLLFVKRNLYFLYLKMIVIFMYLFITIETFIINRNSLTGSGFKDILEFLLIIIGPYAITLVLKTNKTDTLTEENKTAIKNAYSKWTWSGKHKPKHKVLISFGSTTRTKKQHQKSFAGENQEQPNESFEMDDIVQFWRNCGTRRGYQRIN